MVRTVPLPRLCSLKGPPPYSPWIKPYSLKLLPYCTWSSLLADSPRSHLWGSGFVWFVSMDPKFASDLRKLYESAVSQLPRASWGELRDYLNQLYDKKRRSDPAFRAAVGLDSSDTQLKPMEQKLRSLYEVGSHRSERSPREPFVKDEVRGCSETSVDSSKLSLVLEYFEERYPGLRELAGDNIRLSYNVYTDIHRETIFGAETTVEVAVDFDWEVTRVEVRMYTGVSTPTPLTKEMAESLDNGLRDRRAIARGGGFTKDEALNMKSEDLGKLRAAIMMGESGQNKLTRLVKGWLLFMDIEELGGEIDVLAEVHSLTYDIDSIVGQFTVQFATYIYSNVCSWEEDRDAYNVFLYLMTGAYPCPLIPGADHVTIPADGARRYVVSMATVERELQVKLTKTIARRCLVNYATSVGVLEDLEQALVIACSLRQNRYFSKVALPRVVSYDELVRNCVARKPLSTSPKPQLPTDPSMRKVVGRLHQMQSFVIFKDICVRARLVSAGWAGAGRDYTVDDVKSQEQLFSSVVASNFELLLLQMSSAMKWLSDIDMDTVLDTLGTSIFEGIWTLNNCRTVTENGIIAVLRNGPINMLNLRGIIDDFWRNPQYNITLLLSELALGGVEIDKSRMGLGTFAMDCCIRGEKKDMVEPKYVKIRGCKEEQDGAGEVGARAGC